MDLPSFRTKFEALSPSVARTRFLLDFAETAMQTDPAALAPLVEEARLTSLADGATVEAALCDRLLGWLALDRSDFAGALERFHRALATFDEVGDRPGRLLCLNGIASVKSVQGRFDESLQVYREALSLAETLGDEQQALILQANLGEDLTRLRQFSEAVPFLERALAPGLLSPLNESLVRNQLARALVALGREPEARTALDRSLALARQGGYTSALAMSLALLGSLEAARSPGQEAEALLAEALGLAQQAGDRATQAEAQVYLGRLFEARGLPQKALEWYERGRDGATDLGARPLASEAWGGLALAHRSLGQWRQAYEAQVEYQRLALALYDDTVGRQVALLKADQARRETDLLKEQTRTMALLGDLGRKITATHDLETIVMHVFDAIGGLMKVRSFALGLYDAATGLIEYPLAVEDGVRIPPFSAQTDEASFSGWVLAHGQAIKLDDSLAEYHKFVPTLPRSFGDQSQLSRSCLYVPLMADDRALGILTAQNVTVGAYSDRDLSTMKTLASWVTVAVENARLFDQVHRLATLDGLTGAFTRRHLFDRTEEEFQRFLRDGVPLALVMVDLDHFKALNDTRGHAAGDQALAEFGALCLAHKRPHDLFGRYGGEEFALVLSASTLEGAVATADRLCQAVRALVVTPAQGQPFSMTASFGVTVFHPTDDSIIRVFSRADEALYAAKQSGRDRVAVRTL